MDSMNVQEIGMPEEDNNLGMGRSYECVFCKRGFNTAQALGGHMNIHRKDRARNKPANSTNSSKHEENNYMVQSLLYQRVNPSFQQQYVASHEASQFSPAQPFFANHHYKAQRFNPFGVDIHRNMSFGFPCGTSAHVEDFEKVRRVGGQEDELDLELRLGHQ